MVAMGIRRIEPKWGRGGRASSPGPGRTAPGYRVTPSLAEQLAERNRVHEHQGFGTGVALVQAGIGDVRERQAEAGVVVEAIGEFQPGSELHRMAQILAVAVADRKSTRLNSRP